MFHDNLLSLRKRNHMSQEKLAEKIGVSRQTISKYETGEALPDILKCKEIADVFDVSLDELVNYQKTMEGLEIPPRGKHMFGTVEVKADGSIVLPEGARRLFQFETGGSLVVLGDEEAKGLALMKEEDFMALLSLKKKD